MIDWLTLVIDVPHTPIPAGRVIGVNPDGSMQYDIPQAMQIEGSFEQTTWCRSQGGDGQGRATELYIHGNPAKFLQGHNVFGSDDVTGLATEVLTRLTDQLDVPADIAIARARRGEFSVKRIDITRSYQFADRAEVQAVLSTLAIKSRSRMGRAQTAGGTVYHGKKSRRHTLKFYCKGEELEAGKKHRLPDELAVTGIKDFAENLLRAELTLRSKELKELGLEKGSDFTPSVIRRLYDEYFSRIEMSTQATIPSQELMHMRRAIRDSYLLWQNGIDVRPSMSKPTFYRHRHELLGYGVDIAIPNENVECQVIPMFRQVVGTPVEVPAWAYEQGLIFDPKRVGG